MNPEYRISRLRSFFLFVVALIYAFLARLVATHAAHGLSGGDWYLVVDRVLLLFLLLVGFRALGRVYRQAPGRTAPAHANGLVRRPGIGREFGVGAATGWGLLLLTVLPSVFIGGLVVTVFTAPHQWSMLLLGTVVLLLDALAVEVIFRGYPFQRLIDAVGPSLATLFMSLVFAIVYYTPDTPRAGVLVSFLLSWILCLGYLRTRALWLPWGLHFAWNAAMGLLFGLPISGYTRFSPVIQSYANGPDAVTGGYYGPGGSAVAFFVLLFGLWLILRVTREYAHRYAHPEIVPGGIPVDIDAISRRQHEVAMGPAAAPAEKPLVQIGSLPPASAPPTPLREPDGPGIDRQ
ncbi:MAG: CPBP family intramembrane glutamic endopeptidase [Acidobacteriaceae bacterium]